jgi:hypothetical protein
LRAATAGSRAFGRGSAVFDYWLGRCEGFELVSGHGRQAGVVERVVLDESGRARAIVVRTRILRRSRVLDPRALDAVVPEQETIAVRVDSSTPRRPRPARTILTAATRGGVEVAVATVAWTGPRLRGALAVGHHMLVAAGTAAHRHALLLLAGFGRLVAAGVRRARPRVAELGRLVRAGLTCLGVFLSVAAREVSLALKAYRVLVAQEAARRRAAAHRRAT